MTDAIYKSYFNPKSVAERYAKGRPRYHLFVVQKIKEFLKLKTGLARALDVGCGTGFSSIALKEVSDSVYGCDLSSEMLSLAEAGSGIDYLVASGEKLPFKSNSFEIITVAQAIHWMDRDKFFNEVRRSLKPNCWLVAYDNYFLGEIENEPSFRDWFREGFLKTFPTTPRNRLPFETDSKDPDELVLVHEERHRNLISLTQRELTDYFLTITNVINVIEKGEKSLTEARSWMLSQTDGFFSLEDSRDFSFSAPIWYFRRLSEL